MGAFSIWHWLVLLIVVMIVFGTKKLGNLGGDLGAAIHDFKKALKEDDAPKAEAAPAPETQVIPGTGRLIDAETSMKDSQKV